MRIISSRPGSLIAANHLRSSVWPFFKTLVIIFDVAMNWIIQWRSKSTSGFHGRCPLMSELLHLYWSPPTMLLHNLAGFHYHLLLLIFHRTDLFSAHGLLYFLLFFRFIGPWFFMLLLKLPQLESLQVYIILSAYLGTYPRQALQFAC